jgi:hypothetical protein
VNGWGFKRITEGPDLNAYYHEKFLRGLSHICVTMRRPQKGCTIASKDIGQCPDFYKISKLAPLPESENQMSGSNVTISTKSSSADEEERAVEHRKSSECNVPRETKTINNIRSGTVSSGNSTPEQTPQESVKVSTPKNAMTNLTGTVQQSPDDFPHTQDVGDCLQSSSSSVTSWMEQNEYEQWGNLTSSYCLGDDRAGQRFPLGHVTPPSHRTISLRLNGGRSGGGYDTIDSVGNQVRNSGKASMKEGNDMNCHNDDDKTGLSAADLCYLTQQNIILLDDAQKRAGKGAHPMARGRRM